MAYPKSHNPFADEDEEERGSNGRGFDFDDDSGLSDAERRQRYLQQEVMRTAQSAVDSSHRSLGLIYESEKMGTETAEVCPHCRALQRTSLCPTQLETVYPNQEVSLFSLSLSHTHTQL